MRFLRSFFLNYSLFRVSLNMKIHPLFLRIFRQLLALSIEFFISDLAG